MATTVAVTGATGGLGEAVARAFAEDGATVALGGRDSDALASLPPLPGVESDPRSATGRAPAYRYGAIRRALEVAGANVEDHVLDASDRAASEAGLPDALATDYDLRTYQREALDAWRDAGDRGVLELPTGAGKTVIAIRAMVELGVPTLVVVPTVDLLDQWQRELAREFDVPIGRLGGGEQRVEDVTVATYDSAYLRADELGDRFGLVVFDEVHHLGAEGYQDIARLMAAPDRLGLTATFERPDGAHEAVEELVGDVRDEHEQRSDEAAHQQSAAERAIVVH
jgi:superfamily II DNA or RNA helicase